MNNQADKEIQPLSPAHPSIPEKAVEESSKSQDIVEELQSSEGELIGEECIEEQMTCYKCNGTKINKRGRQCKKCSGTGVFAVKGLGDIAKVVSEEVENFCNSSFKELFGKYMNLKNSNQEVQSHARVSCDGCNLTPITGVRYMCSVCNNFDLCASCEAKGLHSEHPMLKIRKPHQAPHSFVCQFKGDSNYQPRFSDEKPKEANDQILRNTEKLSQKAKKAEKILRKGRVLLKGRFVSENIGDKHEVISGSSFTKQWVFRNDGETAWPIDVKFEQTSGDYLQSIPVKVTSVVQPGSTYTWEVTMTAPERVGRYNAFFRMQTNDGTKFGHKVWCDI